MTWIWIEDGIEKIREKRTSETRSPVMGKARDKKKRKEKKQGEKKSAKNKEKSGVKLSKKGANGAVLGSQEEMEDIDAILRDFENAQLEKFKVSQEENCGPPSRRVNASLTVSTVKPEELVLVGGELFDGKRVSMYNDHFVYNTEKAEWKRISSPNQPGPRASHQAVATTTGFLFLFGGEFVSPNESNFFHYKDFWMLDLKTHEWEKLEIKGKPSPRSGHRMTRWKQYLVLFGGFFDQVHDTKYLDDLWLFDTQEFKWIEIKTPEPRPCARSGFQFLCHYDEIVLYGGYSKTIAKGKKIAGVMHTDTWTLKMHTDLSLIKWERKKKAGGVGPGARSGCTTIYHKGRGFMFGGVSDIVEEEETLESLVHGDFFHFNLDTNKFYPCQLKTAKQQKKVDSIFSSTDTPQQPGPRFNCMLAVTKNTLYLFGGILEEPDGDKELTLNDFWSINADKMDQWTCLLSDETLDKEWLGEEEDSDDDDEEDDHKNSNQEEEDATTGDEDSEKEDDDQDTKHLEDEQEFDPLPDPELEPKPRERMGEYYERTSSFWLERALNLGDFGGKVLRRVAFRQSERHFLDRLPANELLAEQLRENEVELEEAAAVKKESEARSRNR